MYRSHWYVQGLMWAILSAPLQSMAQFKTPMSEARSGSPVSAGSSILDELLAAKAPELTFRPDDTISVAVFDLAAFSGVRRVERDGSISFPFIGNVQVAGLTVAALEQTITMRLKAAGIMQDPQVTVTVVAQPWNVVTVSGDTQKPGVFPALGNLTLLDYLSEAGGLQDNLTGMNSGVNSSASSVVTLIRPSLGKPIQIEIGADAGHSPYAQIPLFGGDEVRVGRVGVVYAVGAFKSQGAFPLKNMGPTTVLQLIALAGGIGYEADLKDTNIIRVRDNMRYTIGINIRQILKGQMADIQLQAGDILFVPTSQMKAAIKGGGAGAIMTLGAAAIYAHP